MARVPDPDRRIGRVWRIESKRRLDPDRAEFWAYVLETTRPDQAKSDLAAMRNAHRTARTNRIFRVRFMRTQHYIEDW